MDNKEKTSGPWACSNNGNVAAVFQSADGVTDETCSNLGVATVQDLCARLNTMYEAIFGDCDASSSPMYQLERRCERVNNGIIAKLGEDTGIDWM